MSREGGVLPVTNSSGTSSPISASVTDQSHLIGINAKEGVGNMGMSVTDQSHLIGMNAKDKGKAILIEEEIGAGSEEMEVVLSLHL